MAHTLRDNLLKKGHNISLDLIQLYLVTRDPRPDLYRLICEIEILLHKFVKDTLENTYQGRWWREGIPQQIRKECADRKEEDPTPLEDPHAYGYTTFIHLKKIIDENWSSFSAELPREFATNKQKFLKSLDRINTIRNRVMHPVKTMSEYEDDHHFLRKFLVGIRKLALTAE
jgi:hypothetical protein